MKTPLDSVYAKLDRARSHARDLDDRLHHEVGQHSYKIRRYNDGHPAKLVYKADRLPTLNPEWSLILGDFLTNLRSALDHLAWQLVLLDGSVDPDEQTQFPIYDTELNSKGNPRTWPLREQITRADIRKALEAVQPYKIAQQTGASAENTGLFMLNELVRIDKHRVVLVIAAAVDISETYWPGDGGPAPGFRMNTGPLKQRDPVAWFDFTPRAKPYDGFDPKFGVEIRVNDAPKAPAVHAINLIGLVNNLYDTIEHLIIGMHFAHLFGLSPRHWHALTPP